MRHVNVLALAAIGAGFLAICAYQTSVGQAPATATAPAATQKIDPSKLDAQGYIRQWLLLAPINFGDDYVADDIEKEQIKDEAKLTPKEGDKLKVTTADGEPGKYKKVEKELTWKKVVTEEFFFDFNDAFKLDVTDAMGGYAVAYLDAPEEMKDIKFSLGSNDNGLIYLNGKKVYSYIGGRSTSEDADVAEKLTLNKGVNVVIFKVWNDSNAWTGNIRLLTKDDKPITNVKVQLSK